MTKIEQAFKNQLREQPDLSTLIAFNMAIMGKKYSRSEVGKAFNKLVDKDDYKGNNKERILQHTLSLLGK